MSKYSKLIDEVADQKNHSLMDVLLKAKVLAYQLKGRKFRQWVNSEIDGYDDPRQVPDYRVVEAKLYGDFDGPFGSSHRRIPLSTSHLEPSMQHLASHRISTSVSYIEDTLKGKGPIGLNLDGVYLRYLRKNGDRIEDHLLNHVFKEIARHALVAVLMSVRSRLLEFLLELLENNPELDTDENATARISEAEVNAVIERKVYQGHNITVHEDTKMRDVYQAGQAGAMGPNASAENMNFIQVLRDAIGENSLADLAGDLEKLRTAMLSESKSAKQDEAVAAIADAEDAARKGDAKGLFGFLKRSGKWAMDVAAKVGANIAAKAIEKSMGM